MALCMHYASDMNFMHNTSVKIIYFIQPILERLGVRLKTNFPHVVSFLHRMKTVSDVPSLILSFRRPFIACNSLST